MTPHRITTVLGSLLIGLVTLNTPSVSADDRCLPDRDGRCALVTATMTGVIPGQNPAADAAQQYRQEMDAAAQAATLRATRPFSIPTLGTVYQRVCTHPSVGFPTCYTAQDDGTWTRAEWAETGTTWVVVGTVTFAAVMACVGEVNATAP
jgi:hypothetical protein